jgi:hypothetical protein
MVRHTNVSEVAASRLRLAGFTQASDRAWRDQIVGQAHWADAISGSYVFAHALEERLMSHLAFVLTRAQARL